MTAEEQVIEILMEAEAYGIREEVIQYARHLREINIRMDRIDAYEVALSKIKEALENE